MGGCEEMTCRPQLFVNRHSRGIRFEPVFMMKAAEDRRRRHTTATWKAMTACTADRIVRRTIGNARPQARVWPPPIVMRDPLQKNGAKIPFAEYKHEV